MKRADLQRVCKVRVSFSSPSSTHLTRVQERGLKANLKTDEMIDLLLDLSPFVSPLYSRPTPTYLSFCHKQTAVPSPPFASSHGFNPGRSSTIRSPVAPAFNELHDNTLRHRRRRRTPYCQTGVRGPIGSPPRPYDADSESSRCPTATRRWSSHRCRRTGRPNSD
jgi:hypothetical protein